MGKEILTFGDIETEKNIFYCSKTPPFLKDVDVEKADKFGIKSVVI